MTARFIPDEPPSGLGYKAVGFEQAYLEDKLAGYESTKAPEFYKNEILTLLAQAGATNVFIQRGQVQGRTAYLLHFGWGGADVRIVQVALPTRTSTERAQRQAERQALYHLLNEIRFELERRHFHPDYPAFVPYMLSEAKAGQDPAERRTLGELIGERLALPAVAGPG